MSTQSVRIAALGLCAFACFAQSTPTVSGKFAVAGKPISITYVFAALEPDTMAEDRQDRVAVLFATSPLPEDMRHAGREWIFWAGEQARDGKLSGIVAYLNPRTNAWTGGQLLSHRGLTFYSLSVSSPELSDLQFTPASAPEGRFAGRLTTKRPFRTYEDDGSTWTLDIEFSAQLAKPEAVSAELKGPAALSSPQYKAIQSFLAACRTKNIATIRSTLSAASQSTFDRALGDMGEKAALEFFSGMAAETQALKLARIVVRGERADVVFQGGKPGDKTEMTLRVALDAGQWKMAP